MPRAAKGKRFTTRRMALVIAAVAATCAAIGPVQAGLFGERTKAEIEEKLRELGDEGKRKTRAGLHSDLATIFYREGSYPDAVAHFEQALGLDPSRPMKRHIYLYLGKSHESSGRLDKAIDAYEKAVDYDSKNWKRHRDLAWILERVRLHDRAIESYERALLREPRNASLHLALARNHRRMGLFSKAENHLADALGLQPASVPAYRELSFVYEGQGRFGEALLAWEKTLADDTTPAEDWARFVYLAVLADNRAFANQGMNRLREMNLPSGSFEFYESLVELAGLPFDARLAHLRSEAALRPLLHRLQGKP